MKTSFIKKVLFLFILTSCFSACSSTSVRRELANQGPQRLDERNGFILANQYLAEKVKESPIARGFIRNEGTPDVISVKKSFWGPYKTQLFYLKRKRAFLLEENSGQTIVKGPAVIPTGIYRQLSRIRPLSKPAALVLQHGGTEVPVKAEDFYRTKKNTSKQNQYSRKRRGAVESQVNNNRYYQRSSLGTNSGAVITANPANRTARVFKAEQYGQPAQQNDVVGMTHIVTKPTESLWTISKWYTGTENNLKPIASFNNLQNSSVLNLGQEIKIPKRLLRTSRPLPN